MPIDSDAPITPPRRRLPLRYLFTALVAVLMLPIVVWLVWGWIEAARLDRALDALAARQEPLDIEDVTVKPTTPEQREASHLYARARKLAADLQITSEQSTVLGKTIEEFCSDNPGVQSIAPARANVVRIAREACSGDVDAAAKALFSTLRLRHLWPQPQRRRRNVGATFRPGAKPSRQPRRYRN